MDETTQDQQTDEQTEAPAGQDDETKNFDPEQVENDPAYNPDHPGFKGIKGG